MTTSSYYYNGVSLECYPLLKRLPPAWVKRELSNTWLAQPKQIPLKAQESKSEWFEGSWDWGWNPNSAHLCKWRTLHSNPKPFITENESLNPSPKRLILAIKNSRTRILEPQALYTLNQTLSINPKPGQGPAWCGCQWRRPHLKHRVCAAWGLGFIQDLDLRF